MSHSSPVVSIDESPQESRVPARAATTVAAPAALWRRHSRRAAIVSACLLAGALGIAGAERESHSQERGRASELSEGSELSELSELTVERVEAPWSPSLPPTAPSAVIPLLDAPPASPHAPRPTSSAPAARAHHPTVYDRRY